MDPLSQASLGAVFSQNSAPKKYLVYSVLIGALSGMAADLDILIRSQEDSLLFLDYHRQFTHSLIFIPVGALLCALFFYALYFRKKPIRFSRVYMFAFLGYASHGLLDACTSYGTQLFWPFSNDRISWNNISIIDPLFTFPIISLVLLTVFRKKIIWARLAFIYMILYLGLGFFQENRAEKIAYELAQSRGHQVLNLEVKPSFANLILWKSIYETEDRYYVDAIRVFKDKKITQGQSILKLNYTRDLPWLDENSRHAQDIKRFTWFSQGFVALSSHNKNLIIDVRYSMLPHQINSLWGIYLNPEKQSSHVQYKDQRKLPKNLKQKFLNLLLGK